MPTIEPLLNIVLRTTVVYLGVLLGMRLIGKREVGQMTPFDLVLFLLLANAVQNAMTGPNTSLAGGLAAAATLLLINLLFSKMTWRFRKLIPLLQGSPTILIHHGKILEANLKKEKVTHLAMEQALREHGISGFAMVELAVLEVDGSISVLRKDEMPTATRTHHHIRFLKKRD